MCSKCSELLRVWINWTLSFFELNIEVTIAYEPDGWLNESTNKRNLTHTVYVGNFKLYYTFQ